MAAKQPFRTAGANTSIEDIEKNIQNIAKGMMDLVAHPLYPVSYPDLDNHSYGYRDEELPPAEFTRIYNKMGQERLYSIQAEMAAIVIHERFSLANALKHQVNLLIHEFNRLNDLIKTNKIDALLEAAEKRRDANNDQ
jgi:hypothetical protein